MQYGRDSGKRALFAAQKSMKIKCAALRKKGQIIATGLSHESAILAAGGVTGERGFLTTSGKFLSREQAAEVALASGQASEISSPELGLSSSDLDRDYPPEE
jgi:hypothetical protein